MIKVQSDSQLTARFSSQRDELSLCFGSRRYSFEDEAYIPHDRPSSYRPGFHLLLLPIAVGLSLLIVSKTLNYSLEYLPPCISYKTSDFLAANSVDGYSGEDSGRSDALACVSSASFWFWIDDF